MAISAAFLKKLGVNRTAFHNFVKTPRLKKNETDVYAGLEKMVRNMKRPDEDGDEDDFDPIGDYLRDDFCKTASCCGTVELSEENEPYTKLEPQFYSALVAGEISFIFYSVDKRTNLKMRQWGFKKVDSYINPNSGNRVYVWYLNVLR